MRKLREIIDARKQKAQFEKEAELKAEFRVVEGNGSLWLTHCGVAFMKVSSLAKAEDVAKALNDARNTAVEFEKL